MMRSTLAAFLVSCLLAAATAPVQAQGSTADEIAKYRQMLLSL